MTTTIHRNCVFLIGLGIGVLAPSCVGVRDTEGHCWHAKGDATCRMLFEGAADYCTYDQAPCGVKAELGCVAELPEPECHSPCGGGLSELEDVSCVEIANDEAGEEPSASSESSDTADDLPCQGECSPHLCMDEVCVQCNAADASNCTALSQLCNETTYACEPCTTHHQCPGEAGCHILAGTCLPSDMVLHVGDGQGQLSLTAAFDMLGDASGTVIVHAGPQSLPTPRMIAKDQVVAVVGVGEGNDDMPVIAATTSSFELSAGHLYLERVHLTGSFGVVVSDTSVVYADSIWAVTEGFAFSADGTSKLYLRNSMLASDNWSNGATVAVFDSSNLQITYSTLIATGEADDALACADAATGAVRNSIIGALPDAGNGFSCLNAGIAVHDNALEVAVEGNSSQPFVLDLFKDPANFDYHIIDNNDFNGVAVRKPGDPIVDIDGNERLDPSIAGADVP